MRDLLAQQRFHPHRHAGKVTGLAGHGRVEPKLVALMANVPAPVVGAMFLLVVSYNMGEWREIPELFKQSRFEIVAWLVTFLLTVFADLTVAVEAGMILAVLVFIRKVTQTTTVSEVTAEYIREGHVHILQDKEIPAYVSIFRIHGPFLFGATDKLDLIVNRLPDLPPIIILRLRNMTAIDSTGLQALENFADRVHETGRQLVLCGAMEQPEMRMQEAEFHEHVGEKNICHSVADALDRAKSLYHASWWLPSRSSTLSGLELAHGDSCHAFADSPSYRGLPTPPYPCASSSSVIWRAR